MNKSTPNGKGTETKSPNLRYPKGLTPEPSSAWKNLGVSEGKYSVPNESDTSF